MLTKVLQERKCSAFLPLSLRQLRSDEPEEATGDEAESTPSSPVATAAGGDEQHAWERLKSSLMPQLRTAIADPATKEKVTKIVVAAQASEKAGQYAQATAIFHRLAGVLQIEIPKPAVVRPPRAAPLQAALNKLTPAFRRAVAEKPERKKQLLQPVVVFQQQLKAGELEQARETLRQVSRVLQSVLAA